MNPIETRENIVAVQMATLIPFLNNCVHTEFVDEMTSLIRTCFESALTEATNHLMEEMLLDRKLKI